MIIRSVRWSDFDDLRETYYRLYEERDRGEPIGITLFRDRPSLADEVDWFSRQYHRVLAGDSVMSVAEVDGRVVGNCVVDRAGANASSEAGHVGTLGILVDAAFRGRGVGSALLRHAIDACRGKFEVVRLSVFSVNQRAQRLYRRFGFEVCGHVPRAVRRGSTYFDEELMVLVFERPPESTANR
jgi:ribosomal protein S18 acetylase RimI-like enzyme